MQWIDKYKPCTNWEIGKGDGKLELRRRNEMFDDEMWSEKGGRKYGGFNVGWNREGVKRI